ncbi:MAG: hypothetical protein MUF54_23475, partial [Polyangiaceae bacterium]|nr:hypothetical protein [Polyangiaceae bacterium]
MMSTHTRNSPNATTSLAPAIRAEPSALRLAVEKIRAEQLLLAVLEATPGLAMVLNPERQIVAANRRTLDACNVRSLEEMLGQRLGEAIRCRNSGGPGGCGASEACALCGGVQAVLESRRTGKPASGECRIPLAAAEAGALDVEVIASPAVIDGMQFTVVVMRDISAEKRRHVLERLFFHDVLNTVGGMRGLVGILSEANSPEADAEYKALLRELADRLIELVQQQRELAAAESGELHAYPCYVSVPHLLETMQRLYARHDVAESKSIRLGEAPDVDVATDPNLLQRVIGNMVKNALEATPRGGEVLLFAEDCGEHVAFFVRNYTVMSDPVRLQVFQRSFSTKGNGRGIGTYSMRLLGESYLGATVGFHSS